MRETSGKFHLQEVGKILLFNPASFYQAPNSAKVYEGYKDEQCKSCQLFYNLKWRKARTQTKVRGGTERHTIALSLSSVCCRGAGVGSGKPKASSPDTYSGTWHIISCLGLTFLEDGHNGVSMYKVAVVIEREKATYSSGPGGCTEQAHVSW